MRIIWSQSRAFNANNLETVPNRAGVYLLWAKQAGTSWRTFYVGSVDDLQSALRRHLTTSEPNTDIRLKVTRCVTGFACSMQPDPEVRHRVAKFLYDYYRPECGSSPIPADTDQVSVNLPAA